MKTKKLRFNAAPAITALAAGAVAFGTLTGTVQEYITFAGPLNEMAFFIATAGMAGLSLMVTFTREVVNK